jgi:enoyl-[acyl-carrier protein] reductase/trans-2-enoyl-CoA reductase (NAD+)
MVIKPMIRSNMCMNAHPVGCQKEVLDQIGYVRSQKPIGGLQNVLIIGASTGYGLASRIVAAFGAKANTFGVSFEREPSGKRTGTMGYYSNQALEAEAKKAGLIAESINGDAFSHEIKADTIARVRELFGKVDLVVYSLASPVRKDPDSETTFRSVLKPIGQTYTAKSINPQTGEISEVTIEPANDDELADTVRVMGGDDWKLWMDALAQADVLADGVKTVAYSYIGPEVTRAVYRDGTIGKAKEHLERTAGELRKSLSGLHGEAYVSVNKALVTRASAVIPVVPLYLSLLFKVMKEKGIHEGCIEQMYRLFSHRLYGADAQVDDQGRIRMDDWELRDDVQSAVDELWPQVNSENVFQLADLDGYNRDFLAIHGFGREDIDYEADIDTELAV